MPSFASALESTLHKALEAASSRRHEYATLEHLLLALVDDEHASKVMSACGVDLGELGSTVAHYLDTELEALKGLVPEDAAQQLTPLIVAREHWKSQLENGTLNSSEAMLIHREVESQARQIHREFFWRNMEEKLKAKCCAASAESTCPISSWNAG